MKERMLSLLLLIFCLTITAEAQDNTTFPTLGDVNGDGTTDVADIVEIINFSMGKASPSFNWDRADINHDGIVNMDDVEEISKQIILLQKESKHSLQIHFTNGTTETIMLNTFPHVSMTSDVMTIRTNEGEKKYSRADVLEFTYQ